MSARIDRRLWLLIGLLLSPANGLAQTTTYYLHNESSTNPIYYALKPAGPDVSSVTILSPDLKNQPPGTTTMRIWETLAGVPGLGGTIPSGSTVTFKLWMKKTAAFGVISAYASLIVSGGASFCSTTGPVLSTTLTEHVFSCVTTSAVTMTTSDQLRLGVGYTIGTSPGNKSVKVQLNIETTHNSRVEVPNPIPPDITGINPTAAPVNWSVTVSGTNFGATQGSSTIKFNNTTATPTNWGNTSIVVPVPAGASTGPVVVTVGGASDSIAFTVIPPPALTSLNPTSGQVNDSVTVSGINFLATQGTSTLKFNGTTATPTTWNDTTIVAPVPSGATSGSVVVTVSGQASNSLPFTVIVPGTIAGTITQSTGSTPLAGATVQAVFQGVIKSSATTPANGTYSLPNLNPGTYDLRVHASGYSSEVRSAVVTSNVTTTVDVAMLQPGSISGTVTQASGGTPIGGAAVAMFLGGIEKARTSTNASGAYSIGGLHPGAYTLQVAYVGYRTSEQGQSIQENANTTANVSLASAPSGPVTYVYDELGRLVSVVDPSGDAATYTYDAVGNILSIGRIGAGTVAITEFTPNSAPPGAPLTIYGTGFSTTPSENTVTVKGLAATVTSSTATRIVTSVPAGATPGSGAIGVTTPTGSANASPFTVTASSGVPTISGFTPAIAAVGSALTVNGTNYDPVAANNRVTVNVAFVSPTAVTATAIDAAVPGAATSGKITVTTPIGTAVSTNDLFVPPPGFTPADVAFTGRMTYGDAGSLPNVSIPANKIGLVLFDGTLGQRASVKVTLSTITSYTVKVFSPAGAQLGTFTGGGATAFIDTMALPQTGTYTVLVDPSLSYSGSMTLTVYNVPPDVTGTITPGTPGDPVLVTTDVSGQNGRLTLSAVAGQRISVTGADNTMGTVLLKLLYPDGTILASSSPAILFIDTTAIPAAGTYTLLVDPQGAGKGNITVRAYNVTDDVGTITPGGPTVTVNLPTPGQKGRRTFSVTGSLNVSLTIGSGPVGSVTIVKLPSTTIGSGSIPVFGTTTIGPYTLTAGDYEIVVDPLNAATGSVGLTLNIVP